MDQLLKDLEDEEEYLRLEIAGITSLTDLHARLGELTAEEKILLDQITREPMPDFGLDPEQFERIHARVMENLGDQER